MKNAILKFFVTTFIKPLIEFYLRKKRSFSYKQFKITVFPSVFHPQFFFSTKFLLEFISTLNLTGKTFLEPGCGTGIVSLLACSIGAETTSLDLNPIAVENTIENFKLNKNNIGTESKFKILHSDLFDKLLPQSFDYIVINPPYFFKKTTDESSLAWNCGENGEYFEKLFKTLGDFSDTNTKTYIVLAENCEINRITEIADHQGYSLNLVHAKRIWWEENYVFQVKKLVI